MIAHKKTKEYMKGLQLVDQTAFAAPVYRSSW